MDTCCKLHVITSPSSSSSSSSSSSCWSWLVVQPIVGSFHLNLDDQWWSPKAMRLEWSVTNHQQTHWLTYTSPKPTRNLKWPNLKKNENNLPSVSTFFLRVYQKRQQTQTCRDTQTHPWLHLLPPFGLASPSQQRIVTHEVVGSKKEKHNSHQP